MIFFKRKELLERNPLRRTDHFEELTQKYLEEKLGKSCADKYHCCRDRLGAILDEYVFGMLLKFDEWLWKNGYEKGLEADLFIAGDNPLRCTLLAEPRRMGEIFSFLVWKSENPRRGSAVSIFGHNSLAQKGYSPVQKGCRFSIDDLGRICLSLKDASILKCLLAKRSSFGYGNRDYWSFFKEDWEALQEYFVRNWHRITQDDLRDVIREAMPDAFPSAHIPEMDFTKTEGDAGGTRLQELFAPGLHAHARYNRGVLDMLISGNAKEALTTLLDKLTEINGVCRSLLALSVECPQDLVGEKAREKNFQRNIKGLRDNVGSLVEYLPQCEVIARNWIRTLNDARDGFGKFSAYFTDCAAALGQAIGRHQALAEDLKEIFDLSKGSALASLSTEQTLEQLLVCNQAALVSIDQIRNLVIPSVCAVIPSYYDYASEINAFAQKKSKHLPVALEVVDTTMRVIALALPGFSSLEGAPDMAERISLKVVPVPA